VDFRLLVQRHFDAGDNQKGAENIHDPVEAADQRHAREDENAARDQRQKNPPEQRLVFVSAGNVEVAKDQHEDKEIVDAERVFNQVSGHILDGFSVSVKEINPRPERQSQRHPEGRPEQRFLHLDDVGFPVEDAEIQRQHRQNEHPKEDPPNGHDIRFLCLQ